MKITIRGSAFCTFLNSMCPAVFHCVSTLLPYDFPNSELPLLNLNFQKGDFRGGRESLY